MDIAINMITTISDVWDWLNDDLIINIPITIPVILPDGINFDLGLSYLAFVVWNNTYCFLGGV